MAILLGMDKLLLRPTEAADLIGVGRSKLYQLLATGELPSIRIGGSVRVPLQKLRDWVDEKALDDADRRGDHADRVTREREARAAHTPQMRRSGGPA